MFVFSIRVPNSRNEKSVPCVIIFLHVTFISDILDKNVPHEKNKLIVRQIRLGKHLQF